MKNALTTKANIDIARECGGDVMYPPGHTLHRVVMPAGALNAFVRAVIGAHEARRQAGQEAACWIDTNDLQQMQDKGRGSIVWKRPQDGYEQTALYTAPQAAAVLTSRDEWIARIRDFIALDRCDGETEYAAGANAARDKYLAYIDAVQS
jgi:hypothetical protein